MHSAQSACEIVDFLCLETPDFISPNLWHPISDLNPVNYKNWAIMQHLIYQTKICSVDERRVIDIWCGLEQLTINMAIDHWRRRLRTCIHSNKTCELTILILSVSITFSVTFVWLLPCYIFHSKSVPTTSTIRPITVFVLQGSAAAKSGYGAVFILRLGAGIWCLTCQKIIKIGQQLPKLQQMLLRYTCSFTCTMRWVHLQGSAAT